MASDLLNMIPVKLRSKLSSTAKKIFPGSRDATRPTSIYTRLHNLLHPAAIDQSHSNPVFLDVSINDGTDVLTFSDVVTSEGFDAKRRDTALSLVDVVTDAGLYTTQMDDFLSNFAQLRSSRLPPDSTNTIQNAMNILNRMPPVPQQLHSIRSLPGHEYLGAHAGRLYQIDLDRKILKRHGNVNDATFIKERHLHQWCSMGRQVWEALIKNWLIDSNTLKILLWIASIIEWFD
ncbi:hypothetical protein EV356DRAFT_513725 [Viridothelium virens]|uniref:Uncharacterized protein n=1 Tax=Viridothelium virens TaxID=1048519 RepID=A0A6A6GSW7_VIRVR|nr:hypothetical protein EV356DRAFT_513725 [Viridothelium virens]